MSKQAEFWKQMVNEYQEVSKKIWDFDARISQGNLLNTNEGVEYHKLKETRDRLIWSMGMEFPNMHAVQVLMRGKDVPTLIESLEEKYSALLDAAQTIIQLRNGTTDLDTGDDLYRLGYYHAREEAYNLLTSAIDQKGVYKPK